MGNGKRSNSEAAQGAFRAKKDAEEVGVTPEIRQRLERETDTQHAYFSSLVSGTKLPGTDFRKIVKSEEAEV